MLIFRYLAREILATVVATMVVLLVIFISNEFVHYLNTAAAGQITPTAVFKLMSIQVPLLMGFLLPLSYFLGVLLVVGRLCSDHELIAMYSCGFSRGQLLRIVLTLGLMVALVVAWLMLSIEPKMQLQRARIIINAAQTASLEKILPGRFQQLSNNQTKTFYARQVSEDHKQMLDVLFADSHPSAAHPGEKEWDIVSARSANQITQKDNGQFLVFNNGYRYIGVPGQLDYRKIHFGKYELRIASPADLHLNQRTETLPTMVLWRGQNSNLDMASELQWRFALPLSVIILALLAFPLSEVNPRSGKFARIIPAILIYIVYANLMLMARSWIVKGTITPQIGIWWVHAVFLVLALIMLFAQAIKR